MKQALILLIALFTAVPAYAQSVDATLDSIIKDSKDNFVEMTAVDKSDKDLKFSNDEQVRLTREANRLERQVKDAIGPLQMDANRADQERQRLVDMGCPEGGGEGPIALVQRCNPRIRQHKKLVGEIERKANDLKKKKENAETLRKDVAKTLLNNTQQQKNNDAKRERLQAERIEIQTRAVMFGLKNKVAAEKACSSMPSLEGQVCCHKVVFDGADPKSCGIELVCQAFERAGVFGSGVVICRATADR